MLAIPLPPSFLLTYSLSMLSLGCKTLWIVTSFLDLRFCNMLTFGPAVNRETGASGRRHQDIALTMDGWIGCKYDAHRKQVGVKQWYNPVRQTVRESWSQLVGDKMLQWEPAPSRGLWALRTSDWAAKQNEKEVLLKTKELGGNMLQFVQSPTHLSHITLS